MIRYSAEAEADVRRLHDWLFERNQNAALRLLVALDDAIGAIAATPHAFPLNAAGSSRRYIFRFGRSRYVIHYVEDNGDMIIVRLWHGREDRS